MHKSLVPKERKKKKRSGRRPTCPIRTVTDRTTKRTERERERECFREEKDHPDHRLLYLFIITHTHVQTYTETTKMQPLEIDTDFLPSYSLYFPPHLFDAICLKGAANFFIYLFTTIVPPKTKEKRIE